MREPTWESPAPWEDDSFYDVTEEQDEDHVYETYRDRIYEDE